MRSWSHNGRPGSIRNRRSGRAVIFPRVHGLSLFSSLLFSAATGAPTIPRCPVLPGASFNRCRSREAHHALRGFIRAHSCSRLHSFASYASGASTRVSMRIAARNQHTGSRFAKNRVAGSDGIYFATRIRHSPQAAQAGAIILSPISPNCRCVLYEYARP